MSEQEYLKPSEISKKLKVGQATPYAWIKDGKLPHYRFGKSLRVSVEDLKEFLREHRRVK